MLLPSVELHPPISSPQAFESQGCRLCAPREISLNTSDQVTLTPLTMRVT